MPNHPPSHPLADRVRNLIHHRHLLGDGDRILVGFSGGPDSTALLMLLAELDLAPAAVHFHHGLRPEADRDQAWCRAFCRRRAIPFEAVALDVPTHRRHRESTEMAARRLRLDAWKERAGPRTVVALAHHRDDLIETALIRLLRGANASGICGLRTAATVGSVRFIRPLLDIPREALRHYLAARGVTDWRHDTTNDQPVCLRNRIRHQLIPLLHDLVDDPRGLTRSIRLLRDDANLLETLAAERLPADNGLTVDQLRDTPPPLRTRLLRAWARRKGDDDLILRSPQLDALNRALEHPPFTIPLSPDRTLTVRDGRIAIRRPLPRAPEPWQRTWPWREQPILCLDCCDIILEARIVSRRQLRDPAAAGRVCFPADTLPNALTVRSRRAGDRMVPFGADTPVRLKKLIAASAVPPERRRRLPVIATDAGGILWVPGVRRSAAWPLHPDDTHAVVFSHRPRTTADTA